MARHSTDVGKSSLEALLRKREVTGRDASLILVMKDGKIIEQGRHEELLEKKGFYYNLYNSQFQAS